MSSPLFIRDAVAGDHAAWRKLWDEYCAFYQASVPDSVSQMTWSRILDPFVPLHCRIALRGQRIVGFAHHLLHLTTWTLAESCYLEDLFVDSSARRGGIGRSLIDDLLTMGRAKGWARIYWHTNADNLDARRVYDTFTKADDFVRYRIPL